MKYSIFLIFLLIAGCNRDCPECDYHPQPFRLAILNAEDENLFDPDLDNHLIVDEIIFKTGQKMYYTLNGCSIPDGKIGFCYIESLGDEYHDFCIDSKCEFYITYQNIQDIDTFNVYIEKVIIETERNCTCTGYSRKYIKHNGENITEFDWEIYKTDAAIIRK